MALHVKNVLYHSYIPSPTLNYEGLPERQVRLGCYEEAPSDKTIQEKPSLKTLCLEVGCVCGWGDPKL
jgi:hypothetical protein